MSATTRAYVDALEGKPPRRRKLAQPVISPAELLVVDGAAILRVQRVLRSPNQTLWGHWSHKHRERKAWEATIRHALVRHLDSQARTRADRLELAPVCTGHPLQAPPGHYTLGITRFVESRAHVITDEDNLWFAAKSAIDALVSNGFLYSDRMTHLTRERPVQVVRRDAPPATEFKIAPWWRGVPS